MRYETNYIDGIVLMASWNMKPSYMSAVCLKKENYLEEFGKPYKLNKIILEEETQSFPTLMKELLNISKEELETFLYLIEKEAGKVEKVYTANNKEVWKALSGEYGGTSGFYFLEDIYFVEFEKMVICFMMGNNE